MDSLSEERDIIISARNVTKTYPLYASQAERLKHAILPRFLRRSLAVPPSKTALKGVSFTIRRGEKVGLIGGNGSGKTTLLKLISQTSSATSGSVHITGQVEALMAASGHTVDDFTGRECIRTALALSGLSRSDERAALDDVVGFVELGEFLEYPVRTYSLGMRARLEFAIATAIKPSILIVDEVLGVGDGYFAKKSADRIRTLFSETSLILVSHSMQQVREFCDRVIWLNEGLLVQDGEPEQVIEEYEKFMAARARASQASLNGSQGNEAETDLAEEIEEAFTLGRKKVEARSKEMFREGAGDVPTPEILVVRYAEELGDVYVTETGKPVLIESEVSVPSDRPGKLQLSVFGFSPNGIMMWKSMDHDTRTDKGKWLVTLSAKQIPAGVGSYIISLVLHDERGAREGALYCRHACMFLKLLETNYSDPPYFHVPADWKSEDKNRIVRGRITAWV